MAPSATARPHVQEVHSQPLHQSTPSSAHLDWMMPEYSTMSSQGNYYTNLLSQQGVDVSDYADNVDVENELPELNDMNSQPKAKGRSKNSSEEEDLLLVSAYLNVGKNAITGRDQKDDRRNESGKTINDKIGEAKAMFLQMRKKPFSVFHCWDLLKDERKYASQCSPESQMANEDAQPNAERPLGRKAEKERVRKPTSGAFVPNPGNA
ncbi:hypothetical protein GUJ93_ZPchr0006g42898 [Zizania palustris]|uniref:No apical meristem-associated C-terminal domain-containing protein n=1 Tax=Zizania palustris TaxID=103762 RepID=A0A8J5T8D9_ZIZPA|nr:hypothetical protein GUJ93_ZPchr0006g42898 [Zizania palustris]